MRHAEAGRWAVVGALAIGVAGGAGAQEGPRLADYYGFKAPENYKLGDRILGLLAADLDGDGADDVAIINNARSRIDLLLTTPGPNEADGGARRDEANALASDRRMRLKTLPVNKEVVSLQAADFDADGKVDLAYYGTPAEILVLPNQGEGRFGSPRRVSAGEGVESTSALVAADLNRDGKPDLALLGTEAIAVALQSADGTFAPAERLPHAATRPAILKAVDLDGDGGLDLALLDGSDDFPIRVRFSGKDGVIGPEERFRAEAPRAIAYGDIDGRPGAEVLTIESQSGRARVFTLTEGPAEGDEAGRRGRLVVYPLPQGNARGRSTAVGDLDGDKRPDVVVTDPANAQVIVFRHESGPDLSVGRPFPNLGGAKGVRVVDLDGDGKAEVVVVSESEKRLGLSKLDGDRLTFPEPLPTVGGDPTALEAADLDGDGKPEILYTTKESAATGGDAFKLRALKRADGVAFAPYAWGDEAAVELKGLSAAPTELRAADLDRDGQADLIVFQAYGPPIVLRGRGAKAPFEPVAAGPGPLAGIAPSGLTVADLDGPAVLVAQGTFARRVGLDAEGRWQVIDQFNSGRSTAQILAAAPLGTGEGAKEIALFDRTGRALVFLEKRDGVYRPGVTLPIGAIDFQGAIPADFDGDSKDDLLLAGTDKLGLVLTGGSGRSLKPIASYESNRTDARLADLVVGDLNHDGRPDVALTDTVEHFVEVVTPAPGRADELVRGLAFKLFEQKSLRDVDDLIEPRDLTVGDVDGDGRTDLILVVHDRILVYRQDPGDPSPKAEAAAAP